MAGKKAGKLITALALAVVIAVSPAIYTPPAHAVSLSELQRKQEEAKRKQQETAQRLKELKADQAKKQEYQAALQQQIDQIESRIDQLNDQINILDADILQKEAEIAETQASIDSNFEQFKQRLRAIYLMGETSTLEIILGAKDIADFLDKSEVLRTISEHDTDLIEDLRAEIKAIQSQKEAIEASRQQVANDKKELDSQSQELSALVEENKKVLAEISADVVDANSANNQAARERQAIDKEIDQWYQDYYASIANNNSGNQASGGYVSTGQFVWPVPGYTKITSYWGDGRNHKGLDIAGSGIYGKKIVAADSGKVVKTTSGWGGGYGVSVDIDHGGGYMTRYAHCSKLAVKTGDVVTKGQVIAYVGSTGDSSGPHLHYEIRINGVAKNPMQWYD